VYQKDGGSNDASHDERNVRAQPGRPYVAQWSFDGGEQWHADLNKQLHGNPTRDAKAAARLAWVKVHAQGEPTDSEPGHPQARNGNAIRVSVPFLKDVVHQGKQAHPVLKYRVPHGSHPAVINTHT